MTLPPFDQDATCPKCGGADVNTRYIAAGGRNHLWRPQCGEWSMSSPEHMDRHCRRCGFEWAEAPISAEATAQHGAPGGAEGER